MPFIKNFPKASWRLAKIAIGGAVLTGLAVGTIAYAQAKPLPTVDKVELDKYLGAYNVTATYTLNENGNIVVGNKCYGSEGNLQQSLGEAFVENAPFNTKLRVSFLPEGVRWIPVARGDYWILKLDNDYQTVLVGEPRRKYLWVLSRTPQPKKEIIHEYLNYAKSLGYDIRDVIYPEHR